MHQISCMLSCSKNLFLATIVFWTITDNFCLFLQFANFMQLSNYFDLDGWKKNCCIFIILSDFDFMLPDWFYDNCHYPHCCQPLFQVISQQTDLHFCSKFPLASCYVTLSQPCSSIFVDKFLPEQ